MTALLYRSEWISSWTARCERFCGAKAVVTTTTPIHCANVRVTTPLPNLRSERYALRFDYRMAIQGYGTFKVTARACKSPGCSYCTHVTTAWSSPWGRCRGEHDGPTTAERCARRKKAPPGAAPGTRPQKGLNTLRREQELFIDAYRGSVAIAGVPAPGRRSRRGTRFDWHPFTKVVEDRHFPVGDGFAGGLSIFDQRLSDKTFVSTIYSESSLSFASCATAEATTASFLPVGSKPLRLEEAATQPKPSGPTRN